MTMPDRLAAASAALAHASRVTSAAAGSNPAARAEHDHMANAIRALAMDAVEQAKSGHPGLPMGAADIATVLFTRFLKFDPADPAWPDRDRFVLSAGHGSMLLYALLYLLGYEKMTIEEIKRFRQLGSLTPGHPEYGHTPGVETTTGPLGQGLADAVGMAIAERHLAAVFGGDVVDHTTYVLASDGDLMEGISQEAIALAGHLKLKKLIVLYDDNGISIDGPLALADSVDQVKRFEFGRLGRHADRRPRSGSDRGRDRSGEKIRQAVADRLPHHHRLRRADQGRHREEPRIGARRRGDRGGAAEARLDRTGFRDSASHPRPMARCRRARPAGAARLAAAHRRAAGRKARRVRAPHRRRVAGKEARGRRTSTSRKPGADAERDRHPRGLRTRARTRSQRRCRK